MSDPILKPIVVIGGGGHASVLVDILRAQRREIVAVVCPEDLRERAVFEGINHLSHDDDVFKFTPQEVLLVNGIGMLPNSELKRKLNQYYLTCGYQFETVIAGTAQVSPYAKLETGVQIFPGAIVQAGTKIGAHTIINTGVVVEHDCDIGQYNHIAPRSLLCGQVTTEDFVFVGANATILPNILICLNSIIGAGAIVKKNLSMSQICYPNKSIIKSIQGKI